MAIVSSPIPGGSTPTGENYNALRNDALYNHDHSGANGGHAISHTDLVDIGTSTHAQLEATLTTLNNKTQFTGIQAGTWTPPTGGNYNWGSWLHVSITFATPFLSAPKVLITIFTTAGVERMFAPIVVAKSTTGFSVAFYSGELNVADPALYSFPVEQYLGFDWMAIAT